MGRSTFRKQKQKQHLPNYGSKKHQTQVQFLVMLPLCTRYSLAMLLREMLGGPIYQDHLSLVKAIVLNTFLINAIHFIAISRIASI